MRTTRSRILVLVAVLAMLAAACGDDGGSDGADPGDDTDATTTTGSTTTSTTGPTTTETIPESGEALVDLQIIGVTFGADGFVTIENRGADDADVNGIFLCQRPSYQDLGALVPSGVIAAGATVEIPADTLGGFDAAGGEAALYTASDFGSADAIFAYVQWGTGGGRAGVAAEAGIWPSADSVVTPDPAFGSIELFGDPADPESWS